MAPIKNAAFTLLIILLTYDCANQSKKETAKEETTEQLEWTNLIDDNLSNWDTYLSFKHKDGYDGSAPKDEKGNLIEPIGLNKEGYNVFTTIKEGNESIIKVGGEYYGCIVTKEEYSNYHLQLKFKWGDKKWVPRMNKLKDSGILYHSIGPHGAEHWRSWMLSQEFQIMQGHMGDYWSQANSAIDIRAFIPEYIMSPAADLSQDFLAVGQGEQVKGYVMRSVNTESPNGEWTELELITMNGKSLHIVNGVVVMALKNSRYVDNEIAYPLTQGKIQIQSEAAEVFFKDIWIKPLQEMPDKYKEIFLE